ncbi:RmlC-like cupin domain-containing protein [Geopyxis carbonaria]|nr:RmlC-like cupin domain-containing protein [Geopyxis carbonaria]
MAALPTPQSSDPQALTALIASLDLSPHPEGGFFRRTHVNPAPSAEGNASTSIHYLLTPTSPIGYFHRNNKATIYHLHHRGRGRYVLIHPPATPEEAHRVEILNVGPGDRDGERIMWVVGPGVWKSSFVDAEESQNGLLISEVVVPGWEASGHEFLSQEKLANMVDAEAAEWMRDLVWKDGEQDVAREKLERHCPTKVRN